MTFIPYITLQWFSKDIRCDSRRWSICKSTLFESHKNIIRCLTHVIISYIKPYTIFLLYRNECFANKHNYRLNNRKYWLGMWLWDLVKRVLLRLQRIWPWYAVLSLIFSIISLLFLIFIPRREIWRKKLEFILITSKVRMVTKKWNCRFGR